jgi:hypothetical protein
MKIILAIFAVALAAVLFAQLDSQQTHTTAPAAPRNSISRPIVPASPLAVGNQASPTGELLRIAGERLNRYASLSALIRYRIHMFGAELIGSGLYQQAGQGTERRFRLELKTKLDKQLASRLQVCDGKALWIYRESSGQRAIERIDIERVRQAVPASQSKPPNAMVADLAIGGLPMLLEGLQTNFQTVHEEPGYLGDAPMWAVQLEWKPSVLTALAPDQLPRISAGEACDFSALPQVPERVTVYLDHQQLFPCRIEFVGRSGAGQGRGDGADGLTAMLTVEFTDVQFDQPIDSRQFIYDPGRAPVADVTGAFLQGRGLVMPSQ